MAVFNRVESSRRIEDAIYDEVILAGNGWMHELFPGQVLRIVDLEGNQAVDTLFYDAENPEDHYSAVASIAGQSNIYLTTGSILRSESGKELLKIIADTCGRHDTLGGGCCSAQSNTVRYSHDKLSMHNCRDTFMLLMSKQNGKYTKRDLVPNVNFL